MNTTIITTSPAPVAVGQATPGELRGAICPDCNTRGVFRRNARGGVMVECFDCKLGHSVNTPESVAWLREEIAHQERLAAIAAPAHDGRITAARITNLPQQMFGPNPEVIAMVDGTEVPLFDYYSDEISFTPEEFLGLTVEEGRALKQRKDKAYLQS
jgi:hypothetical protein